MAPKQRLSTISYLPLEIIVDILLRLPLKDLIRFMCVCKAWNTTIHNEKFIEAYHRRPMKTNNSRTIVLVPCSSSSGDFCFSVSLDDRDAFGNAVRIEKPPLRYPDKATIMLGCCNGLVCINNIHDRDCAIWNPSIRRFKRIPFTTIEQPAEAEVEVMRFPMFGLGYDSTNDDYKIVRVVLFRKSGMADEVCSEVKIYSLKSNSWKKIQNLPSNDLRMYVSPITTLQGALTFLNGALHWLMRHKLDGNMKRLVSLDLATEQYNEFPCPPVNTDRNTNLTLHVLGGYLCVCVIPAGDVVYIWGSRQNDVWIMREYGVAASWTRLYTIEEGGPAMPRRFRYCKPLAFSNTGEMVLLENAPGQIMFWYDYLQQKRGKQVDMPSPRSRCSFLPAICVENLHLLDGDPVTVTVGRQQQQVLPSWILFFQTIARGREARCKRSISNELRPGARMLKLF
ncbi:hypothetical protein M0R45_011246 [Rubus argutus]|uniref:F-box domain-containing protein n=1 Tax=Rubus argutus TaxID=59490 RepID=A0AAW1YA75_RUBAR